MTVPALYECLPPPLPLKIKAGHCTMCGIKSEIEPCAVCAHFLATGHWLTDTIDVQSLLEFMAEVWGSEMTRESIQGIIDNDPTIAFTQDMMRGAYQQMHEEVG
jgi:hypothetical protein